MSAKKNRTFGLYKVSEIILKPAPKDISPIQTLSNLMLASIFGFIYPLMLNLDTRDLVKGNLIVFLAFVLTYIATSVITFLSLPYLIFILWPLSIKMHKKHIDNVLLWVLVFPAIGFLYALILVLGTGLYWPCLILIPVNAFFTGIYMWGHFFDEAFSKKYTNK